MSADDHWYFRPLRKVHRIALPLSSTAIRTIRQLSETAHPRETGGLLLGWWDRSVPVVRDAVEVLDPRAGHSRWTRHEEGAAESLAAVLSASNEPGLGYVGEWHSHPADVGPSCRDIRELRRISRQYSLPIVLAVARRRGPIDTRLARNGRLTTPRRLAVARQRVANFDTETPQET